MWKRVWNKLKEQRPDAVIWVQRGAYYYVYPDPNPSSEILPVKGKENILIVV